MIWGRQFFFLSLDIFFFIFDKKCTFPYPLTEHVSIHLWALRFLFEHIYKDLFLFFLYLEVAHSWSSFSKYFTTSSSWHFIFLHFWALLSDSTFTRLVSDRMLHAAVILFYLSALIASASISNAEPSSPSETTGIYFSHIWNFFSKFHVQNRTCSKDFATMFVSHTYVLAS